MDINWFESFLYGIVSGLTEFLPVSARAHQAILRSLFGMEASSPVMDLAVTLGALAALLLASGSTVRKLIREQQLSKSRRRRRKRNLNMQLVFDWTLVRTACVPLLLGFLFYGKIRPWEQLAPVVALFLILNGIILYLPMLLSSGNKDSRNMSALDGVLVGLGAMLGIFPGISRVGAASSIASSRGADPQQAFKWSLLLSIPALLGILFFEFSAVISAGLSGIEAAFLLKCVLAAAASYVGSAASIGIMRAISARSGFVGFSYYCWGAALFVFILYLC